MEIQDRFTFHVLLNSLSVQYCIPAFSLSGVGAAWKPGGEQFLLTASHKAHTTCDLPVLHAARSYARLFWGGGGKEVDGVDSGPVSTAWRLVVLLAPIFHGGTLGGGGGGRMSSVASPLAPRLSQIYTPLVREGKNRNNGNGWNSAAEYNWQ